MIGDITNMDDLPIMFTFHSIFSPCKSSLCHVSKFWISIKRFFSEKVLFTGETWRKALANVMNRYDSLDCEEDFIFGDAIVR